MEAHSAVIFEAPQLYATPAGFVDRPYVAMFRFELAAGQVLVSQPCQFDSDTAMHIRAVRGLLLGDYCQDQMKDAHGWQVGSGWVSVESVSDQQQHGTPVFPELIVPPNGQLMLDVRNNSADSAVWMVAFMGVKRYAQK